MIPDLQGSVIGSLDSSSGTITKTGYRPFGESGSTAGTFRYTGARIDAETNGLYDFRARIYSPTLGRFLQADPSGSQGGMNLYAYVGNDPLNAMDWLGLAATFNDRFSAAYDQPGVGAFVGGVAQGAAQTLYSDAKFLAENAPNQPFLNFAASLLPDQLFGDPQSQAEANGRTVGKIAAMVGTVFIGGPEMEGARAISPAERELIGSFEVPAGMNFGTTTFGNYAHEQAANILKNLFQDVPFRFQIGPGVRGVDVIVPSTDIGRVRFCYGEIKPLSTSGQITFNRQIQRWGYDPKQVQAITYDAFGNVYFGF